MSGWPLLWPRDVSHSSKAVSNWLQPGWGIKWTGRRISWRLMCSSWILPPQKLIELIFVFFEVSIDLEEAIVHLSNGNGQRNCSTMLHKCPPIQKHLKTFPSKRSLKKKSVSSGAISLGSPVMAETTQSWDQPHCVGLKTLKNYYNV